MASPATKGSNRNPQPPCSVGSAIRRVLIGGRVTPGFCSIKTDGIRVSELHQHAFFHSDGPRKQHVIFKMYMLVQITLKIG